MLDLNFLFTLVAPFAQHMPDFKAAAAASARGAPKAAAAAAAADAPRAGRSTTPKQRRPSSRK